MKIESIIHSFKYLRENSVKIERLKNLLILVVLVILVSAVLPGCSNRDTKQIEYSYYQVKDFDTELVQLINEYRQQNGLCILSLDQFTCNVCYSHSYYMATNEIVNHYYFVDRAQAFPNKSTSEIITYNYSTPSSTLYALKMSSIHNAVVLGDSVQIGIASELDSAGRRYVTIITVK